MACRLCSRELEEGSSFCRFCGAAQSHPEPKALRRFPSEGKIAGVCAGVADYLNADVTLVRLGWIALSVVPGVLIGGLLAYVVAWLFIPEGQRTDAVFIGKRLLRSNSDKTIAGVCGGLAEYLGVDPTLTRVLWVVLSIYPGAVVGGVLGYLVAWAVIPAPPEPQMVSKPA
jgi:phage shock protein PspC (stress-responsive transcriptional regulator)